MGVFKEIKKADGSGVTTFYRLSDVHDTVETDDSEGTATVIDYNAAQNKPSVNGVTLVGNKTSEDLGLQPAGDYITNDEADAKFIDEDELEAKNYVNETRLQEAIANIDHFHREIVNALPVTGQDNVLYMVRKQGSGEDIFNEYIWVGKTVSETGYEFIGTTATDLTDYYQKDEVDDLLDGKVDKVSGRGLSEQNYTLSEKTKLAGLHNYDDTELQVKVANLHNYDDTDLQLRVGDLEVKEEADINAISTIQDALGKKMICIRLVEQGDGWTWMDINGSRLTFDRAQAYLGQENCMLFVEQLENDGKVIPAEYKSETTRIRVLFKDLDSLVHIMTLGEEDLLVEDIITTEDGACDFEVENEAVDFGARLDEFYGNTSQEGTPTPDSPQDIHVVSGDNSIDVCGKNLFDKNSNILTGKTFTSTGEISNLASSFIQETYISVLPNTAYTLSTTNDYSSIIPGEYRLVLCEYNSSKSFIRRNLGAYDSHNVFTITTTANTYYVRVCASNLTLDELQLEQNNQATTYEPYQSQTYPINLGSMELCKIGDYQDRIYKDNGKWYLNKQIGKVVLDGSESNWAKSGASTTDYFVASLGLNGEGIYSKSNSGSLWLTNRFSSGTGPGGASNENCFYTYNPDTTWGYRNIGFTTSASLFSDITSWKTWLSTHNTIVYYVLATPTTTEITDPTLLTQLENLQQITQYKHTYINLIPAADNEMPDAKFTYISNAVINASDRILGKDTYWNDEVPTSADLPANAEEGEIRIVQDTQNVYIYDGYEWIPFDKGGEIDLSNYLAKDNTTAWIPTGDYNPATKKYVDDSVGGVFVPTKTSQLTNDSNFIGKNSNDLTYYYTKSQTYTKSEVDALIGGGGGGGNVSITVNGDTLVINTQSNTQASGII